jgi:hypothetical protein
MSSDSKNWKKKMKGSNAFMPTWLWTMKFSGIDSQKKLGPATKKPLTLQLLDVWK